LRADSLSGPTKDGTYKLRFGENFGCEVEVKIKGGFVVVVGSSEFST